MTFQPIRSMLISKMQSLVPKYCFAAVTTEARPRLLVMNYPYKKYGCVTLTLEVSLGVNLHSS